MNEANFYMTRTQRAAVLVILLTITVTLVNCSSNPAGVYVSSKDPTITMELKRDGSFSILSKRSTAAVMSGTYKVDGKVVTFAVNGNTLGTGKIEDSTITDPDGTTWKKQ